MMKLSVDDVLAEAVTIIDEIKNRQPLVHCITNFVTINDCANALLAFGALPAMCDVEDEVYDFAQTADALCINLGTYSKEHEAASLKAVQGAMQFKKPVVIDPVGCAAIPARIAKFDAIFRIIAKYFADSASHAINGTIIKGNRAEIAALAGKKRAVKGVDSISKEIETVAEEQTTTEKDAVLAAQKYGCTVAATGKVDVITDRFSLLRLFNGTELLTKITGAGCIAGALCGAAAAAASSLNYSMLSAALAAILTISVAGEQAAKKTKLPGSFRIALVDSIYALTGKSIAKFAKIEKESIC